MQSTEKGKLKSKWTIRKWRNEKAGSPDEEVTWHENMLFNEGINQVWTILCSSGGTKFDNANANLGVGDSTAAVVATQTGLQAATNKLYKGMDSGFPTFGTDQKAVWRSTFGPAEANFAWNEVSLANGNSDAAINLNRKVENKGTKNGGTWELTLEITLA